MLPPQAEKLIHELVEQSKRILQENLTGIYLHGSAVMGCFNPEKSDLDFIIVVDRPLPDPVKRAYMDMIVGYDALGPAKGIEMSVVRREVCRPFIYPTPFELHFSKAHLAWYKRDPEDYTRKMNGVDKDLAAHFTVIGKRGRCLYGLPVKEVFAEVPDRDYMDSIWEDVSEAPENIEKDTMYLTLNLARVLAWQEEGLVLSKKEGGEWAMNHLPVQYRPQITAALAEYAAAPDAAYPEGMAGQYAEYVIRRIQQQRPGGEKDPR